MQKRRSSVIFNPSFFETRVSKALNVKVKVVKPVIQFHQKEMLLGYNVGTRGNAHDAAR